MIFFALFTKNIDINTFTKPPLFVSCMMTQSHKDKRYVHYVLNFNHEDCNHIVGSYARHFRNLDLWRLYYAVHSTMSDLHFFIVLFFMGVNYVCEDYKFRPIDFIRLFLFHPFSMFNSIIVERKTSVGHEGILVYARSQRDIHKGARVLLFSWYYP